MIIIQSVSLASSPFPIHPQENVPANSSAEQELVASPYGQLLTDATRWGCSLDDLLWGLWGPMVVALECVCNSVALMVVPLW